MEEMDPLHRHFTSERIHCFINIIEQTVIAILVEKDEMTAKRRKIFGKSSILYLNQPERNRLLKFWYKQNTVKDQICSVLGKWDENTIMDMINWQPKIKLIYPDLFTITV